MMSAKLKISALLFIAAALGWASWSDAIAQQVPQRRALGNIPAMPAPAPAVASRASSKKPGQAVKVIDLSLNKAKIITLARPVGKIVIGNEAIADIHFEPEQPTKIFIVSKAIGSTNVFFMDAASNIIEQVEVSVTFDNSGIKGALVKLLPDEKVDVTIYRDNVFLTGKVKSATAAANAANIARRFVGDKVNVTNMLTVAGSQQVILKVRVSEMDRNINKNLTANTTLTKPARTSRPNINLLGVSPTTISAFATGTLNYGTNLIGPTTFSILEEHALVKTLAEPTLTAISGETASFLAGGEFPFQSGTDDNGNVVFEYREFGIRLEFTPVVLDKGRINLQLSTEISALGDTITVGTVTVQSLTQKRTNTTVELPSGGTIMISGLLENNITDSIRGVPFLKDLPVLGALFRSSAFAREETELVITVTAFLVKPIDNEQSIAVPTDGFEPSSDIDHYLLGRLHKYYGTGDTPDWTNSLKGPFGYIMR